MTTQTNAGFFVGTLPPPVSIDPDIADSQLWLSQSVFDLQVSPDIRDHALILPTTGPVEGSTILLEQNAWWYNGILYLLYSNNMSLTLAFATHPKGPWTVVPLNTFGSSASPAAYLSSYPFAGPANNPSANGAYRSQIYIEGSTLILTYIDATANIIKQATAPISQPMNWTLNASFNTPSFVGQTANQWGSAWLMKDPAGLYHLFCEIGSGAMGGWQIAHATGPTSNGPWTTVQACIASLAKSVVTNSSSAPQIILENGQYCMFYHGSTTADSMDSNLQRAASPDLYRWVPDGQPALFRRRSFFGTEQAANVRLVKMPNSNEYWAFYCTFNNVHSAGSGTSSIWTTRMLPVLKKWDGLAWGPIARAYDPMSERGFSDLYNEPVIINTAGQAYTLKNGDDVIYNPTGGSATGVTFTLPFSYRNNRCRVTNANSNASGTITLVTQGTDSLIASATLSPVAIGKVVNLLSPGALKWCGS